MISKVDSIDPSNKALKYLKKRISDPEYRGNVGSQHNRWNLNELVTTLTILAKISGGKPLQIRTADLSKRPGNIPGEEKYAEFCNEVNGTVGKGTQDSIRKNLFPDYHRAGWIERYDSSMAPIDPYDPRGVVYVGLSLDGQKLVDADKLDSRYYLFSKGVDRFLGGSISKILHLLGDPDSNLGYIDLLELTYFISAVGSAAPNMSLTLTECRDLILEWRKLSRFQKIGVDAHLRKELVPSSTVASKIDQRDYHNWVNASQQGFHILNQTVYFEERPDPAIPNFSRLYWMQKNDPKMTEEEKIEAAKVRLARSLAEKHKYFNEHGVSKEKGFELHHVVALAWAESEHHFKLLDNWKNMVYIDGYNHAKITQNRNLNVQLSVIESDIALEDYSKNRIDFFYKKNIIWDPSKASIIQSYNKELLDFVTVK